VEEVVVCCTLADRTPGGIAASSDSPAGVAAIFLFRLAAG
jgi:hypothetical protein